MEQVERMRKLPRSVGSGFQMASWRAVELGGFVVHCLCFSKTGDIFAVRRPGGSCHFVFAPLVKKKKKADIPVPVESTQGTLDPNNPDTAPTCILIPPSAGRNSL